MPLGAICPGIEAVYVVHLYSWDQGAREVLRLSIILFSHIRTESNFLSSSFLISHIGIVIFLSDLSKGVNELIATKGAVNY